MSNASVPTGYPARLAVDYQPVHDRTTTFFRIFLVIPIAIVLGFLTSGVPRTAYDKAGDLATSGGSVTTSLFAATALLIVFRRRYPRWWYDFSLEMARFSARVTAYLALLTDAYPSTEDQQAVHLEIDYPDVPRDLNRWLPLVKWFLAIPHYVVLAFLGLAALGAVVIAWFAILFTGTYPRGLFDFVVGVGRWSLRVQAYAFLLVTDRYPPFSLS